MGGMERKENAFQVEDPAGASPGDENETDM